jgi:TonB-linked SusC/RagA family outer membrane protein
MLLSTFLMLCLVAQQVFGANTETFELQQRSQTVRGVVSDATGPIAGANVIVKGTTIGVMTDIDGTYSLTNIPAGAILEFSFIGYKTVEVAVGNQIVINVTLEEDLNLLEELVVIGYGTVRKSDLTGSVASVSAEDLTKTSTGDAIQALQGRAAGVQIITNTGSPDATAEIKIRGTGSPNGSAPLYVVDGFPMNDINYLSPNDIASIEILKDASACAIYGSRGANGVVMITTKQAQSGALKVNVKAEFGIEAAPKKPQMLSSQQYAEMTNLALKNMNASPKYPDPAHMEYNTDWFNEVMKTGKYQNYSVTFAGGEDRLSTSTTVNYFSREGTVKSTKFDRFNINANFQYKPLSFLSIRSSLSGSFSKTNSLGANGTNNNSIFLSSLMAPPDIPVWNDVTNYYTGITAIRLANPAGAISRNFGTNKHNYLIGNVSADIKFLKDFTFTSRFGYKYNFSFGNGFTPIYFETSNIASGNTSTSRSTNFSTDWTWENQLTYTKKFNKNHELSMMAAMSARDFYTERYNGSKKYLASEAEQFRYFDAASDPAPSLSGSASALGMLSYLGRINYSLFNRYLLTVSFRADGSSRFIGAKKWGYFPSGAIAWKVSEEPFFKNWNQNAINTIKLRLGWGQIGNERISGYYPYQTNIQQNRWYNLGENKARVNGAAPSGLGNKDLQWETSEQSNIGLDLAFLNNRLTATIDAYIRKTENILLSESVPRVSGASSLIRNSGGMENRGIELTLGWKDDIGDFSYSIEGNVSFVKNTVTSLGSAKVLQSSFSYDNALIDFSGQFSNIIRSYVDLPFGQFYGYDFQGIFQNQAQVDAHVNSKGAKIQKDAKPGDCIYADINDDGKINANDVVRIGDPNPKAVFGLNFNASWKSFDFSMLFQGTIGNEVFNASKFYFEKFDGRQNVLASSYLKGWSGELSTNTDPIVLADAAGGASRNNLNWYSSSRYIEDGSYFRLKNFQLGYTFKPVILKNQNLEFRVYFSAQNLLTLTKYSGLDPELSGNGVDRGQYPQPRSFVFGVNINL